MKRRPASKHKLTHRKTGLLRLVLTFVLHVEHLLKRIRGVHIWTVLYVAILGAGFAGRVFHIGVIKCHHYLDAVCIEFQVLV